MPNLPEFPSPQRILFQMQRFLGMSDIPPRFGAPRKRPSIKGSFARWPYEVTMRTSATDGVGSAWITISQYKFEKGKLTLEPVGTKTLYWIKQSESEEEFQKAVGIVKGLLEYSEKGKRLVER